MGLEHRLSRVSPGGLAALDSVLNASSIDFGREDMTLGMAPSPPVQANDVGLAGNEGSSAVDAATSASMSPQRPSQISDTSDTRSIRSTSSASRNANRLSLTLPIALPNSFSSRPTPTTSMPPTPLDTSVFNSPVDSDDIIIAIAAQERRVLELREELSRAEGELKKLQRQWTVTEGCKKRPPNTTAQPSRGLAPAASLRDSRDESSAVKRNSELERRKAILLAQSQGPLRQHKRTVMRGSHARTLSLLSPTRSVGESSFHEDHDSIRSKESYMTYSPVSVGYPLNKRATWAPRPSTQQSTGVKQFASDFRQGLWTFVEDLRQATVGDEAVSGTTNRTSEMSSQTNKTGDDHDIVRASAINRSRISLSMESEATLNSPSETPTSDYTDRAQHRRTQSRPEARARKHYSWTPLMFDSLNDDDWSSWNSTNTKTSRWSSSTANEDVPVIPEKTDESDIALRRKFSSSGHESSSPSATNKLEELPQTILNHLTPIQNKTSNFIKEWEKSLSPPSQTAT